MDDGERVEAVTKAVENIKVSGDNYRSILSEEAGNTGWRHRGPPIFDKVNKLFEEGRSKEQPKGSIEEAVQNAVKSSELELSHKTRLQDFKTINPKKFKLIVNGKGALSGEETLRIGSYNALLRSSLPGNLRYYKSEEETYESSHNAFRAVFPRGFAWEVIKAYSGPPVISISSGIGDTLGVLLKDMPLQGKWLTSMDWYHEGLCKGKNSKFRLILVKNMDL